ncbi:MAG: thrombospondin type 3 repeat-containing protein [candidate division Zixibacteria bacterium]|nr:thrombospondin type 3 repeat-containing protein [candidate division Zixibacteria bacterium]
MKKKLIFCVVLSLVLQTTTSKAQDSGAPDSLKMVFITAPVNGTNVPVVVECSVFVDSNTLAALSFGWEWDNPNLQMDSAVSIGAFDLMEFGPFLFLANSLTTTNDSQVAVCSGFCISNCFPPDASGWRHIATYYMTMGSWDISSTLLIDTVQLLPEFGSTEYIFLPLGGTEYDPIWGGPIEGDCTPGIDTDNDGIDNCVDNCPNDSNLTQSDLDNDGVGDVCDFCPLDSLNDIDGDTVCGDIDNCPTVANSDQTDADNDGFGAACDCNDTDSTINPNTVWYEDSDDDGYGNPSVTLTQCAAPAGYVSDSSDCNDTDSTINPTTVWYEDVDSDGFGVPTSTMISCTQPAGFVLDSTDNCPTDFNPTQADADNDGIGDACCCIGIRGDVNGDGPDANILDLTHLVDFIFRGSGDSGGCPDESDVNSDGNSADILDLTYLVDVIFRDGPAPPACP